MAQPIQAASALAVLREKDREIATLRAALGEREAEVKRWRVSAYSGWRRACVIADRFADLQVAAVQVVNAAPGEPLTPGALNTLRGITWAPLPSAETDAEIGDVLAARDALLTRCRALEEAAHNVCLPRVAEPGPTIHVPLVDIERLRAALLAPADGKGERG